ncbi:unnamed protein product [Rotaria sp. Silwood1]|nr:unnamed protein product [Rotaria sp. Silwood1]CAF1052082.1 unnamed protein product [Rotaria sp. Silwood1]CAF1157426.1 unnamed protein product [Rotaria sp. Silwood1]CAF3426258.1 unnamed protein product [Rotaria sp. Silwood1]CAF3434869.1 unnamed protein product [Rotaria sp. Silwood1]
MTEDIKKQSETIDRLNETNRKFTTSTTVNILNDLQLMNIHEQHDWQRYELFRKYEQLLPNKTTSPFIAQSNCSSASSIEPTNTPLIINNTHERQLNAIEDNLSNDISEDLRSLTEQRVPDLCILDGEPMQFTNGTKFYCTINDILTSDGEFWVEREFSAENERKFYQFIDILSLFATSYESLKEVYIGQLVALHYESSWHRALVVSKSEGPTINKQPSARVRLVDYGSSLYVNVSQLKWLPEQFYLFPFKAVECVFSEAVKPTFSDTVRLTFKQLVLHKRLRATVYDRDGNRICVLLKCKTEEGIINVYRYLRAHEHKSKNGRMLDDGAIVQCLHNTIFNNSNSGYQSTISNKSMNTSINLTLPILSPPSPIKLTRDQLEIRRKEIKKIYKEPYDENNNSMISSGSNGNISINAVKDNKKVPSSSSQSTPFSAGTIITPVPRLSFTQQ